jgi:hypothetical protein
MRQLTSGTASVMTSFFQSIRQVAVRLLTVLVAAVIFRPRGRLVLGSKFRPWLITHRVGVIHKRIAVVNQDRRGPRQHIVSVEASRR